MKIGIPRPRAATTGAVLLGSAVLFCLPWVADAVSQDLFSTMKRTGEARMAIAALPPYAYLQPDGTPQGYTIDVSTEVMKAYGITKLAATVTTWDAMIPGLQAHQFDFVPAGLNITSARCKVVLFTAPVTVQQDAFYVMPGNPRRLSGYASAAGSAEVKVAVLVGSTQEAFARKQGVQESQLITVPDTQAGIAAVTGGRADAFAVGQFSIPNPAQKGVEIVVDNASPLSGVGIAFRKEDQQARHAFNEKLDEMRSNGTLEHLYANKYGFTNWDVLVRVTKASDIAAGCE
ncbi:MAG TPA: ectoine/hydroxyectoine ABC transporter substrate-binding protein EhuB [Steroidobacteraceae bacterium]|jgi:polar amino acid transport system substrate-binding protein|nr:ectoine/hydroxyectoine ABC transporter substrate-binding protein EhuB [Steroidobacteraceae bacterium]